MRTVILTSEQMDRILKEENNVNVGINSTGNSISAAVNAVTQNKQKINDASKAGDPIIHISNLNSSNGSNDNVPTQHVEVEAGQTPEQAMQTQLNQSLTTQGGDITISGPGISEQRTLRKSDIEKIRTIRTRKHNR